MFDSIFIGMSGLTGFSQGLRVIANNTTNLNTPGFKGSTLQFSDLFNTNSGALSGSGQVGHGVGTSGALLNFKGGDLRTTGGDLDLAIDGQGLFTIKDDLGKIHYTRDGRFKFDTDGNLVTVANGSKVMGRAADGSLTEISIANAGTTTGKATTSVKLNGNLISTTSPQTVSGVTVFDSTGGSHALSLVFTKGTATATGQPWDVALMDGSTPVGLPQQVTFTNNGSVLPPQQLTFVFAPQGLPAMPLTIDLTSGVVSTTSSTALGPIAFASQDGFGAATLTKETFDGTGTLVLTYGNGQTTNGAQLALARFDSIDAVASVGVGEFDVVDPNSWHTGVANQGGFGAVAAGKVEISNVDLSTEFSDLVIMQRGFQASSQIISTASDMLQELFTMKTR